ncbi:MAG TPA: response regulator, partial [Blastocatellia bacterium]|nr:response regulator [Blastocatellia bacterium]
MKDREPSIRIAQRYPIGTVLDARVQTLKPFEAVVTLKDGTKGIIRNCEMSWGPEPEDSREMLAEGQIVRVKVLGMDGDQPCLNLSLRQVERDPWKDIQKRYRVGQVVSCKVVRLRRGGAFVELESAVDGLLPLQEVCALPPHRVDEALWLGDNVEAVIVQLDQKNRQIELSVKRHLTDVNRKRDALFRRKYLGAETERGSSLSDFLTDQERTALISLLKDIAGTSHHRKEGRLDAHPSPVERLKKILIADDDRSFRTSLQRLLVRLGHEVEVAESAEKAVALCTEKEYDLLLIDLGFNQGKMDGLQAARNITSINRNLPVVIVTGANILDRSENIITEVQAMGAFAVLLKPIDLNSLHRVMAGIVEGKSDWDAEQIGGASVANLENFKLSGSLAPPHDVLVKTICEELAELEHSTGASACILFR